jgi:hypothetical protein
MGNVFIIQSFVAVIIFITCSIIASYQAGGTSAGLGFFMLGSLLSIAIFTAGLVGWLLSLVFGSAAFFGVEAVAIIFGVWFFTH